MFDWLASNSLALCELKTVKEESFHFFFLIRPPDELCWIPLVFPRFKSAERLPIIHAALLPSLSYSAY